VKAVVLSIGSELVSGLTLDTHAREIARALAAVGIPVARFEVIDDTLAELAAVFARAGADADFVVASGGLGPTLDDLTRDALALAMGVPLERHPDALASLEAWARSRNRTLSESNLRQATVPRGTRPIPNPVGTAPGIDGRLGRARVFCMPGVPGEMRHMLAGYVIPALAAASPGDVSLVRTVRTLGVPESLLGEKLSDLMARGRRPSVATAVHVGIIDVHIHASGPRDEVERLLAADAAEIERRLGPAVFGGGEDCMEDVVARLLAARHATVAVAESCTGGLLAAKLVNVAGISEHFLEGVVTYSNDSKVRRLGVPRALIAEHGAVSEPVARAMAEGMRRQSGADFAVAVTGIAGPAGGTPEKPVGTTWMAVADARGTEAVREVFLGDRAHIRERAANHALNLLRLRLMPQERV
jgi:nicotinamide-nucleotide amidase